MRFPWNVKKEKISLTPAYKPVLLDDLDKFFKKYSIPIKLPCVGTSDVYGFLTALHEEAFSRMSEMQDEIDELKKQLKQ